MENMEREEQLRQWNELLGDKKLRDLKTAPTEANEVDVAEFMAELSPERTVVLFRMLPKEVASDIFTNLEPEKQQTIIASITDREITELVEELYVDDVVDMLEELPANVVTRVLKNASPSTRKVINQFLNYPENSVGSIMTAEVTDLKKSMTVAQAIARIRARCEDSESIYTCYVTGSRRILEGVITLRELLVARDDQLVEEVMSDDVIVAYTTEDQEEAVQRIMRYDFISLPVVDQEGRLVGVVTVDDVMDVMEEEATEDIEKMAAITPTDKPYLKMTPFEIWKARIPWLMLLMISAAFTGFIIASFESALARWVALTAFIPMLMDTGGNTGSQASVTVIRAISIGDLEFADLPKVLWKELRVALLCAATLGVVNFAKIQFIDIMLLGNPNVTTGVALVVCLTLAFTVICAKLVGCCLPMLAKKLGFDPAVMASPFITTIVDALSLLIYFQIANGLLGI